MAVLAALKRELNKNILLHVKSHGVKLVFTARRVDRIVHQIANCREHILGGNACGLGQNDECRSKAQELKLGAFALDDMEDAGTEAGNFGGVGIHQAVPINKDLGVSLIGGDYRGLLAAIIDKTDQLATNRFLVLYYGNKDGLLIGEEGYMHAGAPRSLASEYFSLGYLGGLKG